MYTKLTLRLDDDLIRRAKTTAQKSGKSLSQLVSDFFTVLGSREGEELDDLSPNVRALLGVLRNSKMDEDDYKRHLEEKYL